MTTRLLNHPNYRRGAELRARLIAYLQKYAASGRPIPKHLAIAQDFGISSPQVCRHLARLAGDGVLSVRSQGVRQFVTFSGRAA